MPRRDGRRAGRPDLLCWAGFAATLGLGAQMFSDKRFSTFIIDVGFQLVYMVGMSLLLTLWR